VVQPEPNVSSGYCLDEVFVFFSNNLGCLGSLFMSALGTLILLILLDVI
jgi:hypothetical protein